MDGGGELHVQRCVVFGIHALAIRLLAELHIGDRIAALLEVSDLRRGIFRRAVNHGHGNHGWQAARDAAGEKEIETDLVAALLVDVSRRVPRVHGRAERVRLPRVRGVLHHILKRAIGRECSRIKLANGIADAVALVSRAMRVAGVGRLRHPDAKVSHRHRQRGQTNRDLSTLAVGHRAAGVRLPDGFGNVAPRIVLAARPELHAVILRVRFGPCDADGVDLMQTTQIDDHPLRMQRIVFAGEAASQIGIALPVGIGVAIGQHRVVAPVISAGHAAVRQRVTPGVPNHFGGRGVAYEVALARRIAPGSLRIPVPGFGLELGVLPVGDRLPAGCQNLFEHGIDQHFVGEPHADPVDSGSECAYRAEGIRQVRRSGIHHKVLCRHGADEQDNQQRTLKDHFDLPSTIVI